MRPMRQAQREALGIRLTTTDPAKEKHEGLSQLRAEGATQRAQYYRDGVFGAQRSAGAGHFLTAVFGWLLNPLHPATPGLSTGSVGHSCLGHSGPPPSLISSFGFQVLPRRWVVERTFGWLGRNRRLSQDYEALPQTEEAFIYLSMIRLMLRSLANSS